MKLPHSVHPLAIGKRIQVTTDADEVIAVLSPGGAVVARHPRCWAKHQTITDPDHARTAKALRGEFRHHLASQARQPDPTGDLIQVEQRRLDTYDQMFTTAPDETGDDAAEGEVP